MNEAYMYVLPYGGCSGGHLLRQREREMPGRAHELLLGQSDGFASELPVDANVVCNQSSVINSIV